jgi:hypothetical protein
MLVVVVELVLRTYTAIILEFISARVLRAKILTSCLIIIEAAFTL